MPAAEFTTTAKLPVEAVWDFVKEMDNWADLVTGYRSHQKESETESIWVLKGDVGVLARTLKFRVQITEWSGPSRVAFTMKGLNEPMEGGGSFEMAPAGAAGLAGAAAAAPRKSPLSRLLEALFRLFFRLFGRGSRRAADAAPAAGEGGAQLRFRLELQPGGPMAPMVSALVQPALLPAAEHLANGILARLEEQAGT